MNLFLEPSDVLCSHVRNLIKTDIIGTPLLKHGGNKIINGFRKKKLLEINSFYFRHMSCTYMNVFYKNTLLVCFLFTSLQEYLFIYYLVICRYYRMAATYDALCCL